MKKYSVAEIDNNTFQVIDNYEKREICVCSNYEDWEDAKERAEKIAKALNEKENM